MPRAPPQLATGEAEAGHGRRLQDAMGQDSASHGVRSKVTVYPDFIVLVFVFSQESPIFQCSDPDILSIKTQSDTLVSHFMLSTYLLSSYLAQVSAVGSGKPFSQTPRKHRASRQKVVTIPRLHHHQGSVGRIAPLG